MPRNPKTEIEPEWPLMLRISKVLADPQRVKILIECRQRSTSPRAFYEEFGGVSLDGVSRDFEVLAQYEWIDSESADGEPTDPSERLYRANDTSYFDEADLVDVPGPMRAMLGWRIFETLIDRVREAVDAGTMEARADAHISWTPLTLDQLGWEKVISKVDALFYSLAQEQRDAEARMAEPGFEPVPMTVALLAFESPVRPEPHE